MTNNPSLVLVLLAAGSSTRLGTGEKKEYLKLGKGTVLSASLKAFLNYEKSKGTAFSNIIITHPQGQKNSAMEALKMDEDLSHTVFSRISFVEGGRTRQESVYNSLKQAQTLVDEESFVLIHDSARPYVTEKIIGDVVDWTIKNGVAVPAIDAVDTFKDKGGGDFIEKHLIRKNLAAVQTPQGFKLSCLLECHKKASEETKEFTDDSEIWDSYPSLTGEKKVRLVEGDSCNKKITYREDIPEKNCQMIRIGFGTDLHRLVVGRPLMIGGMEIPAEKGELGHSDGDVLLHAISDSLLGASGLGDIGSYFPPEDPQWKDADSKILLKKIWNDVKNQGWKIQNMDCVLEFEKPKFIPYRKSVISSIAKILEIHEDQIFVKAKTNEKLDSIGQGDAIKAYCSCLLSK